ncbi:diacylglycerol/lipid kinase family protein [Deinococcus altitudinis]|uniref:diacylglycerol/lipid kinase family protein n=1 Tax=Deinococcus altitudinis TaxID=468914 RepID=UPI003891D9DB
MTGQTPPPNKRVLVIYNPKSGNGDNTVLQCAELLKAAGCVVEARELEKDTPITDYLRDAEEFAVVVAAGGDGTVSSVAYALRYKDVQLLAYPAGTANLIALNLEMPEDPKALADLVLNGRTVRIDLGELTVREEKHGFAMLAGAGADASMIKESEELKPRFGALAYVMSAMRQVNPKKTTFHMVVDGEPRSAEGIGVMVANFGKANFGLPITSDVSPSDGKFTVVVLRASNVLQLLPNLIDSVRSKLNLGDPLFGNGNIETFEASEISIDAEEPFPLQYDGEVHVETTPFSAKVLPGAIQFITGAKPGGLET